jgi:hypothetical protein
MLLFQTLLQVLLLLLLLLFLLLLLLFQLFSFSSTSRNTTKDAYNAHGRFREKETFFYQGSISSTFY